MPENRGFFRKEPGGPMKMMNEFFTTRPQRTLLDSIDDYFREKFFAPSIPIETRETNAYFIVTAELPGIPKDDIRVKALDNELIIAVKKGTKKDSSSMRRIRGAERTVELPKHINTTNMKATYENGLLTVRLPKKRGKSVEIE